MSAPSQKEAEKGRKRYQKLRERAKRMGVYDRAKELKTQWAESLGKTHGHAPDGEPSSNYYTKTPRAEDLEKAISEAGGSTSVSVNCGCDGSKRSPSTATTTDTAPASSMFSSLAQKVVNDG